VVLFEPEIPQNTGNIARTCAAVGARLHLIEPLGFFLSDRRLKRAGLDYWPLIEVIRHENVDEFLNAAEGGTLNFFTKRADRTYDAIDVSGEVYLVFGKETAGLPPRVLESHRESCFRIPMRAEARSLNLSNAVAVVVYEACRRRGFERLQLRGGSEFS
jgi:tRNA (cytidine/uridine-2'-O-)-methyltransferase